MLCNSCMRQRVCVTHKVALSDRTLTKMLQNLQKCELRIIRSSQQSATGRQRFYNLIRGLSQPSRLFLAAKQSK